MSTYPRKWSGPGKPAKKPWSQVPSLAIEGYSRCLPTRRATSRVARYLSLWQIASFLVEAEGLEPSHHSCGWL